MCDALNGASIHGGGVVKDGVVWFIHRAIRQREEA
jgi:hypothetical protein